VNGRERRLEIATVDGLVAARTIARTSCDIARQGCIVMHVVNGIVCPP
jgi:hypothetical protein